MDLNIRYYLNQFYQLIVIISLIVVTFVVYLIRSRSPKFIQEEDAFIRKRSETLVIPKEFVDKHSIHLGNNEEEEEEEEEEETNLQPRKRRIIGGVVSASASLSTPYSETEIAAARRLITLEIDKKSRHID
jgi:hypothetical protein